MTSFFVWETRNERDYSIKHETNQKSLNAKLLKFLYGQLLWNLYGFLKTLL